MINKLIGIAICAGVLLVSTQGGAEPQEDQANRYDVHIVTMGPGDEIFARFGHIAIMVDDHEKKTRKVYNFGTFSFDDPDMVMKYAKGYLIYWLSVASWRRMVHKYREYDREVVVQTLELTPDQAREVARRLEVNLEPENREYDYRHYLDNCCTRIRDLLDDVLDGAISKEFKGEPTGRTYRDWTRDALQGLPLYKIAILYSLGPAVDQPINRWDEHFLPAVFSEDLDELRVGTNNKPLVREKKLVVKRQGPPIGANLPSLDTQIIGLVAGLLLLGLVLPVVLGKRKISRRLTGLGFLTYGLVAGLGGALLAAFWFFTEHKDTHFNENNLATPFLHLWLIGPGLMMIFKAKLRPRTQKILKWYLFVSLGLVLLDAVLKVGPFVQGNCGVLLFAAAGNILAIASLKRSGIVERLR